MLFRCPFLRVTYIQGFVIKFFMVRSSDFRDFVIIRVILRRESKFLLDTLLGRGYNFGMLKREFCKSVNKYISEFQRWAIPLDFNKWFINISRNIPPPISSQPAN